VRAGVASTPRPVPAGLAPAAAGALVLALALPVFLVAGWRLSAWAIGAVLWAGGQALTVLLTRVAVGTGNLAASSVQGFGRMLRALAVMIVVIAVASSDARLALAAALVYALAYTAELGVSMLLFFGAETR
jgi:hypothetical protein